MTRAGRMSPIAVMFKARANAARRFGFERISPASSASNVLIASVA
jgi:hypothetical protein